MHIIDGFKWGSHDFGDVTSISQNIESEGEMRVLVVEDNDRIAAAVSSSLCEKGFAVDQVGTIASLRAHLRSAVYTVMVLDLGLPDGDALKVLPELLSIPSRPAILVLTARGDVESRINGLNSGADDYVAKPFSLDELCARVQALARRTDGTSEVSLEAGNIRMDRISREIFVAGEARQMSKSARDLLEELLISRDRIATREGLENALFNWKRDYSENALQIQVSRLRKALKDAGATVSVESVRGVGYRLTDV